MKELNNLARNAAAANIFKIMSSAEKSEQAINQAKALSDDQLDIMASLSGIPEEHKFIYRSLMRHEDNIFLQKLKDFEDKTLKSGDLILVTGTSKASEFLVKSQKAIYENARSSHVALVHADFICIDAIPDLGVSNRLVSEVLSSVQDDWRVIRFNRLDEKNQEAIQKACAFYLEQPYRILPSRKPAKKFSYCSELARKVFHDSGIQDSRIPKGHIIKPCDFDRIADHSKEWSDVTDQVRPFIEFCIEYEALLKNFSKLFIAGLQLNRTRFEERRVLKKALKRDVNKRILSTEKGEAMIKAINDAEKSLNFTFWDSNLGSR